MIIFIYAIVIFEILIAVFIIMGKSIAGYLLILHLLAEGIIIYLTQRVGRGKSL